MPLRVLLLSCYELGHQPVALAEAWARLEAAGHEVTAFDASVESPPDAAFQHADLIAISVPMHTALRLGVELVRRARTVRPGVHLSLFGLYAWLNAETLLEDVDSIVGGEPEDALVELAEALALGREADVFGVTTRATYAREGSVRTPRRQNIHWLTPHRAGLPPLERYARLLGPAPDESRVVGYVEASRGCKYRCRHCPVVPVYDGRFFVAPLEVVLADAEQQIAEGARHITFGDPDFLNGPRHAISVARGLSERHPDVSFDVTTKVEHIVRHADLMHELGRLGCVFVVTAVESLSDRVLQELDKGHDRDDVYRAVEITRSSGIAMRPSFVPFAPWATLGDYLDIIDFIFEERLVHHVDPVQLTIRLLVPPRSALLRPRGRAGRRSVRPDEPCELPTWVGRLDRGAFGYEWRHPDPQMDELHATVVDLVAEAIATGEPPVTTLQRIRELAYAAAGRAMPRPPIVQPEQVPRLSESWFCCAEPHPALVQRAGGGCAAPSGVK